MAVPGTSTGGDDWALEQMRGRTRKEPDPAPAPIPPKATPIAAPAPVAPSPATTPVPPAPVALTWRAIAGIVLVVVGITGLVLYNTVPVVKDTDGDTQDRDEWADDNRLSTLEDAIRGPFSSYIWILILGVLVIASDVIPMPLTARSSAQVLLLGGAGFFGYMIVLDSARTFGIYFARLLDEGAVSFHIHVGGYLDAAIGLGVVGLTWFTLVPLARTLRSPEARAARYGPPLIVSAFVLVGLVVSSLVPLTQVDLSTFFVSRGFDVLEEFWVNAFVLESFGGDVGDVGEDIATAEGMLWGVFWLALLGGLALMMEGTGRFPVIWRGLGQLMALAGIPLLIGLIFLVLAYVGLWTEDDIGPVINYVPIVVYLGIAIVYVRFVMRETVPFVRSLDIQVGAPSTQPRR